MHRHASLQKAAHSQSKNTIAITPIEPNIPIEYTHIGKKEHPKSETVKLQSNYPSPNLLETLSHRFYVDTTLASVFQHVDLTTLQRKKNNNTTPKKDKRAVYTGIKCFTELRSVPLT